MKRVEQLLRREIGLDPASVGPALIEHAVRQRMKELGLAKIAAYLRLLHSSKDEWKQLVESVVITETWFFRDDAPFSAFVRLAQTDWLPGHPGEVLRVLSIACASGEEPYSLAMALLDTGWEEDRFRIEATDISERALEKAERGLYGRNSFRGANLSFRERHFRETGEAYELDPAVRRMVRFRAGNLLQEDEVPESGTYDFVFCRNLLMYFHRATRNRACEILRRLLSPDGVLFVGPAEVPLAMENGFIPLEIPMAFACQCSKSKRPTASVLERGDDPLEQPAPPARAWGAPPAECVLPERSSPRAESPASSPADLESARRLADAGEFEQATAICLAYLRQRGASAKAYYLLGLLHDARGNPQAMDCYRKTLYLEPDHAEALWQLAMLLEKNGERAEAQVLRHRARRAPRNL
jgi:chemotaxis protein methyltransferase WspC